MLPARGQSPAGLVCTQGSAQANRVLNAFEHLGPDSARGLQEVFNVADPQELVKSLHEAWLKGGMQMPNDPLVYIVNMGRSVGTLGERCIRLMVAPGNRIITTYPVFPR